jgi:hypothetical protein
MNVIFAEERKKDRRKVIQIFSVLMDMKYEALNPFFALYVLCMSNFMFSQSNGNFVILFRFKKFRACKCGNFLSDVEQNEA